MHLLRLLVWIPPTKCLDGIALNQSYAKHASSAVFQVRCDMTAACCHRAAGPCKQICICKLRRWVRGDTMHVLAAHRGTPKFESSQYSLHVVLLHSAIPRSRGQLLRTPIWGFSAQPSHLCQEAPKSSPVRIRTSPCLRPVTSAYGYLCCCCRRFQWSRRRAVREMSSLLRISLQLAHLCKIASWCVASVNSLRALPCTSISGRTHQGTCCSHG